MPVGVKVVKDSPVTRSITNANVDSVRITLNFPQLQWFQGDGDIQGREVRIRILTSYNGGPFTEIIDDVVRGRTTDLYQRAYRFDLTQAPPVDVRVVRVTNNAPPSGEDEQTIVDEFFWGNYTEITYAKLRYPNSALMGLVVDAEQFSNVPSRSYRIRGIKVKIPSNARPGLGPFARGALIYKDEPWDGTFTQSTSGGYTYGGTQWTSDPAWILWDLLTNTRYGFGDHIDASKLDKWAFFTASKYCSALNTRPNGTVDDYGADGRHGLPDGSGGFEPRFSCNVNIQTQEEAYKLINDMCSTFRAMPFWSAGALTIAQDAPTAFSYAFTLANVTEEGFSYSGSSLKTRHTVAVVSYLDLDTRDIAYEVVEDQQGIQKYGVVKTEISAFACTSRGQARRIGEWLLYSEQYATEVVTFNTTASAGTVVRPGQVIQVYDPVRSGERRGGRVVTATTTQIVVDDATATIIPNSNLNPAIRVLLPDGTFGSSAIGEVNGNTITLVTELTQTPQAGSIYVITSDDIRPTLWRVLTVQEEEGALYKITALWYDYDKFDYIERDVPLSQRDVTNLNVIPPAPTNIGVQEVLYESNGQVLSKLIVSWQPVPTAARYFFKYRLGDNNWWGTNTDSFEYEIFNTSVGTYEFEVSSLNQAQKASEPSTFSFNAIGKTAPPNTIPDLFIAPIDDKNAELYWPQSVDLDVRIGGQIRIRHTPLTDGNASWGRANDIVPAVAGSSTRKIVPLLEGTYFIRAVDSLGNESDGVASVIVDLPAPQDSLLVQEYREEDNSPPFNGTGTNMAYSEAELGLILASDTLIDDMAIDGNWDGLGLIDYIGGAASEGTYQFAETLDLGGVYDLDLRAILQTRAFEPGNAWDDRLGLIDDWDDIDGDDLGAANCQLYVRTTTSNPSGTPTWGAWQPFVNNTTRGRGLQFKVVATSSNPAQNVVVENLGVVTQFQRRTETQRNLTSGAGSYAVTFPTAFYGTPSIGITAQDMNSGDYFTVSSVTRTGFTVTFRNSGGSMVSKVFDYQAVGHGRQIS